MEEWKPVAFCPDGYEVSSLGNLRAKPKIDAKGAHRKERALILRTNADGYKIGNFFINGKAKHIGVHRVVFESFVGQIPPDCEINHKNGIRDDNRPCNLEAISHAENIRYSKTHLGADFATYGNGRMTPDQRQEIFSLAAQGLSHRAIGKMVGFSKTQISNVLSHKCWGII